MASLPRIRRAGIASGVASVASGRLGSELYAIPLRAAPCAMLPVYGLWMDGSLIGGRLGCMNSRGNARYGVRAAHQARWHRVGGSVRSVRPPG